MDLGASARIYAAAASSFLPPKFKGRIGNGQGKENGQLYFPQDVCFTDDYKIMLISEASNNRVSVFKYNEEEKKWECMHLIGSGNENKYEGGDKAGEFHSPAGLTIDHVTNRLFVADCRNHRIQVFNITSLSEENNQPTVIWCSVMDNSIIHKDCCITIINYIYAMVIIIVSSC